MATCEAVSALQSISSGFINLRLLKTLTQLQPPLAAAERSFTCHLHQIWWLLALSEPTPKPWEVTSGMMEQEVSPRRVQQTTQNIKARFYQSWQAEEEEEARKLNSQQMLRQRSSEKSKRSSMVRRMFQIPRARLKSHMAEVVPTPFSKSTCLLKWENQTAATLPKKKQRMGVWILLCGLHSLSR